MLWPGLFTERHNARSLKKERKRNEPRGEEHTKKVVIHTMVRKEDGERRRWKGKPGIKGSLRAGSSVLTLSCSVDITDNSRLWPRHHRPTRGLSFFFFRRRRDERWVARRPGSWSTLAYFWLLLFLLSVDVRGGSQWLLTWHSFNPIRDQTRLYQWMYLHIISKLLRLLRSVRIIILSDAVCDDSGMAFVVCCFCISWW